MGIIREFTGFPGGVKLIGLVLVFISLCCIVVFLFPLIILFIAYPQLLIPIGGLAVMSVIGAISSKSPGKIT
jgi:hypothetical protein